MTTYTTINGNKVELTPAIWRGIKRIAHKRFDGSNRLFNACWRQYRDYLKWAINNPEDIDNVMSWLDSIASEKVNNPNSTFYIYG